MKTYYIVPTEANGPDYNVFDHFSAKRVFYEICKKAPYQNHSVIFSNSGFNLNENEVFIDLVEFAELCEINTNDLLFTLTFLKDNNIISISEDLGPYIIVEIFLKKFRVLK